MNKVQAIAIANKLAPSALATTVARTVEINRENDTVTYASDFGNFTAANIELNIASGNYCLNKLTKLFKLMGDKPGQYIEGGCKVAGIKVMLPELATEIPRDLSEEAFSSLFELDAERLSNILENSKNFMQKNNTVSRLIFEAGVLLAFDGARVFMTTAVECEDGSEDHDPDMLKLQDLRFELRPEQIEPLLMFTVACESPTIFISYSDTKVKFTHEGGSLTLNTLPFGQVTSIAAIRPLFDNGTFYTIDNKELNIAGSLKNILSLDEDKNPVICFSKEKQSIHNFGDSINIELDNEPIEKPFQVSGKFLSQCLSVFSEEDKVTLKVYDNCLVAKTEFNKSAMLMLVQGR